MVLADEVHKYGIYNALGRVRELGYDTIEISGHYECDDRFVEDVVRACGDFDLKVCAMSVSYNGQFPPRNLPDGRKQLRLIEDFETVLNYCNRLGCDIVRYAGTPAYRIQQIDDLREYFRLTQFHAEKLKQYGIRLAMHNHGGEFARVLGKTIFQWSIELAPDLQYEFDVLGALHGGVDLYEALESIRGRVPLIHFEDVQIRLNDPGYPRIHLEEEVSGCAMGDGNVNHRRFLKKADECGNEFFIIELSELHGKDPLQEMKRASDFYDSIIL